MADAEPISVEDLSDLSLEELANLEITSVSKRPERLADAPAAIFVITREDIRRSGATSIPEILRLAPNLQVARVRSNSWAITARGFNATSANKLLVLIDGRTVYTPLFSGVFWDAQDTFIEDIERIEVISGPGGTLWGSNAVNGVINITTRHSSETTGGLLSLGGGTEEVGAGGRYGGRLGDDATYRFYAKGFDRDNTETSVGTPVQDGWRTGQAGFRVDWGRADDVLTVQGDAYDGSVDQTVGSDDSISGANVLGRWSRSLGEESSIRVQAYFDRTRRSITAVFGEVLDTWDIEAQHRFAWGERHDVVWGGGFRYSRDEVENRAPLAFIPAERSLRIANVFAQDTIALTGDLGLTLGMKLEDNNFTGLELQPSVRAGWRLGDDALLWSAVSRAVRTPSRLDRDFFIPGAPPFMIAGGRGFESETVIAYELGYRATPSPTTSFSVSAFYNDYDELRSVEAAPGGGFPAIIDNKMEGETWGLEAWGDHRLRDWWKLSAGFSWLEKDLRFDSDSRDIVGLAAAGNDPTFQFSARSLMNLTHAVELDLWLRAVDDLPAPDVPGYVTLDARLGWRPWKRLELSLIGTNLLEDSHPEFGAAPGRSEIDRAVYLELLWGSR